MTLGFIMISVSFFCLFYSLVTMFSHNTLELKII